MRVAATAAVLAVGMVPALASAQAPAPSLTGSDFEIDTDANLVVDDPNSPDDWETVNEVRMADAPSGADDPSFGQGAKEDTAVPSIVDGGIPPNKSDLKVFGVYQEGTTTDGFLNLFWSRVQDPSGTTNMDFEFNQSSTPSGNGVTPVRRAGDLLIQYDLPNGGTKAAISTRTWTGTAWGPATPLNATNAAATVNTSTIDAADSDGIGAQDPRTFGEAQIRLSSIFGNGTTCKSFGAAYLKSRASDAFNSALKDFIAPVPVNISNCGSIKVNKVDDAGTLLNGAQFTLYNDKAPIGGSRGAEDTLTNPLLRCNVVTGGTCTIPNVPQGEYWVVETVTPAGHNTAPDQHATVVVNETVELTFVDPRQRGAVLIQKYRKHAASGPGDSHPHSNVPFTLQDSEGNTVAQGTTDANGRVCFDNLAFGTYTAVEGDHPGYADNANQNATVNNAAACNGATFVGETLTFRNTPLTDVTISAIPQVEGATKSTITCTDQTATNVTDTSAKFENLPPGTYNCQVVVDP